MEKFKVLLLSKDKFITEIFREALDEQLYEIYLTCCPEKIVEIAIEKKIDLFFIEMDIAGMDGYETCGFLNDIMETASIIKVMIVSELNLTIFQRAKSVGVTDFLLRPLYSGEVRIKVENILHTRNDFQKLLQENQDLAASHVGFSVEHYIGQPLTAIQGAVEVLKMVRNTKREVSAEQLGEVYDIIIEASKELDQVIKKFGKLKTYKVNTTISNQKIIDIDSDEEEIITGDVELF